jgi:hypothetical protein
MTNIEVEVEQRLTDESSDDEQQEETVQDNVEVPTPKAEVDNILNNISSKAVKQLSRDERSKLISDFENGVENQYFKVMKMKNGQIRITKRFNPLPTPDKAPEVINNKINKQYNNKLLTNEQLLLEHIFDLERKYEQMRLKHKKLKKRYNKLENDIFDDDSDELDVREVVAEPEPEPVVEPVRIPVEEVKNKVEYPVPRPEFIGRRAAKTKSWRSFVTSF